jgi:hypothetical protein
MTRTSNRLGTIGILLGLAALAGVPAGCGSSKSGGSAGAGGGAGTAGGTKGTGGSTGAGGATASGGITGTGAGTTGVGGAASGGAGGKGTGGAGAGGGAGTGAGGIAAGGSSGVSLGGAGGIAAGGAGGKGSGGTGAGGAGSGGITSLDAGACPPGQTWCPGCTPGTGSCGAACTGVVCPVLDAGCTGSSCALDAARVDAAPSDTPLAACSQVATEADCNLRGDCHSVFVDPGTCGCAGAGCCAHFDHCADGKTANCTGPALCKLATPFCEAPFVLSYTGTCYEGCVRQGECPAPTCPQTAPSNASACGPVDFSCFYEDCAGAGRTQAACTTGKWTVQTAACTTTACAGGGITPGTLTCDIGKICVRTTGGGGAYVITPSCATNACGTGPITTQCIQGLSGSCFANTSLSGVQVSCSLPSSCGSGQGGCA